MTSITPSAASLSLRSVDGPHSGCALEWRLVLQWLREDGVVDAAEAERVHARCATAESSQHPLVRLASVGVARSSDGMPLDLESLTAFVAASTGMGYLRIDPLKVDVARVGDAMSAPYATRHKVLPVQVGNSEIVVATAEPFVVHWVAEVERQTRKSVRRVMAGRSPWGCSASSAAYQPSVSKCSSRTSWTRSCVSPGTMVQRRCRLSANASPRRIPVCA